MESRKRRKYCKIYCPHCEHVSKPTWYLHHSQYYDSIKGLWTKDSHTSQDNTEPDFDLVGQVIQKVIPYPMMGLDSGFLISLMKK